MKELFQTWDRETTLTFVSMIVAAYAWIITEKLLIGIAVGISMHALLVIAYELCAARFSWPSLSIADFFYTEVRPRVLGLFSKTQRA